ncbi:MAG TPA: hypothetical protein VNW99_06410 [Cytophagaceae bacterium]|jgi:hypothetical protein|nr:hypothetical protein [Cytophagaceae bacterium]
MENPLVIEDESARIWLQDGIIHFQYEKDIIVDLKTQQKNIADRNKLSAGIPRPVFADATGVKYWTHDAKQYASTDEANRLALAFAILTNSLVAEISVNWMLKVFKPKVPLRLFRNRDAAMAWLETYKVSTQLS